MEKKIKIIIHNCMDKRKVTKNTLHDSIVADLITMYQQINNICYVCHNYMCMLFMNMRQFINDFILINCLKK
jgi:hypothetical protein